MSHNTGTLQPIRIVVAGAGFGGVYAFKYLHRIFHHDRSVELILVSQHNYFLFTPLLHEVATGGLMPVNVVEPLRKVLGCCLSRFYLSEVRKVYLREKFLETSHCGPIHYDYLVLALGSETHFYDVPGALQHSFTLKSLEDAVKLKDQFIRMFELATVLSDVSLRKELLHFVVVGGGPTGVELAAEMAEFFYTTFGCLYPEDIMRDVKITLLQGAPELLPQFSSKLRAKSLEVLREKRVEVRLSLQAKEVAARSLMLQNGEVLPTRTVVWVAGIRPRDVVFDEDVSRDALGRLFVRETLELNGAPHVFVLGDLAHFRDPRSDGPLPALAQVATKQARVVAKNIAHFIRGEQLQPFLYREAGVLVSLGQWMAVGEIHGISLWGRFMWWVWRTVYLFKLVSWSKRFKVAIDWTVNLFSPRDISEL